MIVNVTPLEPEWRGRVTIEISNTTPLPAKIYANEGIAQMLFFRAGGPVQDELRGQEGQVPGPAGADVADCAWQRAEGVSERQIRRRS